MFGFVGWFCVASVALLGCSLLVVLAHLEEVFALLAGSTLAADVTPRPVLVGVSAAAMLLMAIVLARRDRARPDRLASPWWHERSQHAETRRRLGMGEWPACSRDVNSPRWPSCANCSWPGCSRAAHGIVAFADEM